jgi:O-antigen/teichoic acid export membrane protein
LNLIPTFIYRRIAHRPNLVKILDNIGWLFIDKILRMVVGLFVVVWVARYLGPEQFGQLNYAIAFVSLFGAVAALGLNGIVVRDIVREPESAYPTLGTAFVLQLIGGLIAVALIVSAIDWLRPEDQLTKAMVAILGLSLVFKSSEVIKYWFESQVQSRYTVWVENSVFLLIAAAKVAMILNEAPLIAFVWIVLAEAVLVAVGLFGIYLKQEKKLRHWSVKLGRAKTLLKDSWPLIISSISIIAYMKIDQIMLGEMIGNDAVGIYGAASRISEVWYFIPVAINASLRPTLLKKRGVSQVRYIELLQKNFNLMIWLSVPIALVITVSSGLLIRLLFGDTYSGAADILVVHMWAGVFVFLNNAVWNWYFAENKQYIANIRIIVGLLLNVALNYLLIPKYGVLGAAYATLISRAFVTYIGQLLHRDTMKLFVMMSKSIFTGGLYGFSKADR